MNRGRNRQPRHAAYATLLWLVTCSASAATARLHVPHEAPYGAASCYIAGDSIAQGVAMQMPQCWSDTKVGLNTKQAVTRLAHPPRTYLAILSLGINDRGSRLPTVRNLELIRSTMQSNVVVWILPPDAQRRMDVMTVAAAHHDRIIDMTEPEIRRYVSSVDHVHPSGTGYAVMAIQAQAMAW